jgi:glucosamine-6-phosphate deaminase
MQTKNYNIALQHPSSQTSDSTWFLEPSNSFQIMNADRIASHVAERLVVSIQETLERHSHFVLAPSAGRTLRQTYAVLRNKYKNAVDWSRVICVQMDEYADVGSLDSRSFAYQLTNELIKPLGIGCFISFFNETGNALCSLEAYEREIHNLGGIDCAIHGVGRNAHIAFNEPQSLMQTKTRRVSLTKSTQIANEISFYEGVTLGLDILGASRSSMIVLIGSHKRYAAEALLFHPQGAQNPVAYLRRASKVSIYLDRQALPECVRCDGSAN